MMRPRGQAAFRLVMAVGGGRGSQRPPDPGLRDALLQRWAEGGTEGAVDSPAATGVAPGSARPLLPKRAAAITMATSATRDRLASDESRTSGAGSRWCALRKESHGGLQERSP